ncbi:aminoglycoside phosphotransferase family protein [Inconstantimicrobium mannanitabidum]|uniref:Aminoglycoside phosphotransferase n=1 Tax=Inconstantimicrobium mannanitabidum TaxID=1604901 RepID=A0ACB5RB51_9CLOT|nr:phosphotransferase [Clostridium sp. TW13]GKX66435.1 aminoglycoside phosphotransferase [Clostridium sp. TW13]
MREIPLYNSFVKIESITKGMSSDKKYYIETVDGQHMLLRIADASEYAQKRTEFENMKHLASLGVPMPSPIDFGTCDNGKSVYTLISWIDGVEVETLLPSLTLKEQYIFGVESGQILQKIHSVPLTTICDNWAERYFSIIDPRLEAFRSEGIHFEGDTIILYYLESNRDLLCNRPQCHHHGDYHMGNMIQSDTNRLSIIDWHTVDFEGYGDPWYEFNRIGIKFGRFASGQIDGYFNHDVPEKFWKLFAYYLAASAITSIVWAKYFAPERIQDILKMNTDILHWFDDMKNPIPTWYLRDFS